MKKMKILFSLIIVFCMSFSIVSASELKVENEKIYDLDVLNETIEYSTFEDGTKLKVVTKELDGNIDDLKRILELIELEEEESKDNKLSTVVDPFRYNNKSLVAPTASNPYLFVTPIPTNISWATCFDDGVAMIQCLGTKNGMKQEITDFSTKWTVKGDLAIYASSYLNVNKAITNYKATPRVKVTVWGLTGTESIFTTDYDYWGTESSTTAYWNVNLQGNGLIVTMKFVSGVDLSYKYGNVQQTSTHWSTD